MDWGLVVTLALVAVGQLYLAAGKSVWLVIVATGTGFWGCGRLNSTMNLLYSALT